jgi:RimJ/RimL family protein N-acetyltransferase
MNPSAPPRCGARSCSSPDRCVEGLGRAYADLRSPGPGGVSEHGRRALGEDERGGDPSCCRLAVVGWTTPRIPAAWFVDAGVLRAVDLHFEVSGGDNFGVGDDAIALPLPEPALLDAAVVLRAWDERDVDVVLSDGLDGLISRYRYSLPGTADAARRWITTTETQRLAGQRLELAITEQGTPVGSVALAEIAHGNATVRYWLLPEGRGRGLATRAVRLLAGRAFTTLGIERLAAFVEPENCASGAVLGRCGFVGTTRSATTVGSSVRWSANRSAIWSRAWRAGGCVLRWGSCLVCRAPRSWWRRATPGSFAQQYVRGAMVADGLAELQVRYPSVPIVHCGSRKLAEEWTYRFLAAAHSWARDEPAARARIGTSEQGLGLAGPSAPSPSSAELRAWARANGMAVSERGRVGRDVLRAWQATVRVPSVEA